MRIYIAGPMTGREFYNFEAFEDAAEELRDGGNTVFTPFVASGRVWSRHYGVPFDPEIHECDYGDPLLREFFAEDVRLLLSCEVLFLLPGWRESKGARVEVEIARLFGLDLMELDDDGEWAAVQGMAALTAPTPEGDTTE